MGEHEGIHGGVSRARFLKLAGLGAGLSLFPGSLFPVGRERRLSGGRRSWIPTVRTP